MAAPTTGYGTATITNPSAALTDFTLMIDLSTMHADWWTEQNDADGTKGRAYKSDGTTELPCDWIDFDGAGETGWLRVNYDGTLASSGVQTIRIYPPHSDNGAVASGDAFGSDNVYAATDEGYYPIKGDSASPVTDRTSNGEDIAWTDGDITIVSDKIDFDFSPPQHDGVDLMSANPLGTAAAFTIAAWINMETLGTDGGIFYTNTQSSAVGNGICIWVDITTTDHFAVILHTDSYSGVLYTNAVPSAATEYFVVVTYDGTNIRFYVDGTADTTGSFPDAHTGSVVTTAAYDNYRFGNDKSLNKDFEGTMHEMWVKLAAVPAAWVAEEFAQLDDQAAFWGSWEWTAAGGVANMPLSPLSGPFGGPLSGPLG